MVMSGRYRVRVLPDLVTQRLRLTPVGEDDLHLMRALNADEEVMRNLTGRPAGREETDAEWSQRLRDRSDRQRGLGYWAGRITGDFVGWWDLGACSWDENTANLGYRLRAPYWGNGLATDGSRALLTHAFEVVGLTSVWASTTQYNGASQRVLTKLGMRYLGIRFDQCQYEISAGEWGHATPVTH
jgi:RimJ/RimL family protein N-acetyltransferase